MGPFYPKALSCVFMAYKSLHNNSLELSSTSSGELFNQECESALSDNFNYWLQLQLHQDDQPTSTTDHSFAETTEECTNVSPHIISEWSTLIGPDRQDPVLSSVFFASERAGVSNILISDSISDHEFSTLQLCILNILNYNKSIISLHSDGGSLL